ncbi:MAG: tripartite tricarboxylate transporter TctB family protein [Moraxellaceae bacterium]|nr:tripartite tricarboxylate transporter TctB family protein [Moraxellaceae bacterium]
MSHSADAAGPGAPRSADLIAGILIALVAIAAMVASRDFPNIGLASDVGPARFPMIYASALLVLAALLVINALRRAPKADATPAAPFHVLPVVIGVVATGLYIFVIPFLGYLPTTVVFLVGLMSLMGMRHRVWNPVIAVGITAFLYLVFLFGLSIPLPMGSLFEASGAL